MAASTAVPPAPSTYRRRTWWTWIVTAVVVAAVVWFVMIPQLGDAEEALRAGQRIRLPLLALALALEAASLFAFSALTSTVLGAAEPRYPTLLRIDLAALATHHVVPGGGATAAAVRFRLLRRAGVDADEAIAVATIETTVSNLVLGVLFLSGLAMTLTSGLRTAGDLLALAVVAVVLLASGAVGWLLVRRTELCVRAAQRLARCLPRIAPEMAAELVRTFATRVTGLAREPRTLMRVLVLASANWVADAAALWVVLWSLGYAADPGSLLVVYGLGSLLAMLPLTPGGLGVVEGVMVPALLVVGVPAGVALLGVLAWRLLEYWLPIPVGGIAYLSLRAGPFRLDAGRRRPTAS